MNDRPAASPLSSSRVLVLALTATIVVLGLGVVLVVIGRSGTAAAGRPRVNALANSDDDCVSCHRHATPGIVQQFGFSRMAAAEVECVDCHEVAEDYAGAVEHEGTYVLREPTTAMCESCHHAEVAQYNQSRHGLPAYVAYAGAEGLSPELLAGYEAIPEGGFRPDRMRNALFAMEGDEITRFACRSCHDIGKPAADGSVGQCSKCHLRHEFSLEQVRKPETCNACHIGPDHPQYEIYQESPHGIAYHTGGYRWNWEAEPGTLTPEDFPAPTCAICHLSGFGAAGTTHDVGERLTWYLFAPISERRPAWQDNRVRMQSVCSECHNANFIDDFYQAADAATERVNEWVRESDRIIAPLRRRGLLTAEPFDEPIDFVHFEAWHHWGRTAKFGIWMQGADYVQWHGIYELLADLAELRELVADKLGTR
ncbi:MAG: nitrate reductase [Gemmatimonadetes bacterium]|nr:nitrate reductase [Gemmatimonadota bacterium]